MKLWRPQVADDELLCEITGETMGVFKVYASGWALGVKDGELYAHPPSTWKRVVGSTYRPKPPPPPPKKKAFRGGDHLVGFDEDVEERMDEMFGRNRSANLRLDLDPHHQLRLLAEHIGIQPDGDVEQLKKAVAEYDEALRQTRSTGPR